MLLQLQPVACLAIAPDHAFTGQPDQVRIGKDNVIHRQVRRQATDGDQLVVMPALYPTLAGDPQAAIRSRPQLVDQLVEQAFRPAWPQLPEQPAVDAALLQADAMDLHPDAAIGHQGHQIHPLERVIAGNDAFAAQAAAVPLIPEQLPTATKQDPPIRQHQHRPQGLVIDLLAAEQAAELSLAIEPEQAGVTADQKAIAIGRTAGQADAFQQLALELMHIAKTPPIRRQVGQSLAVGGKPQPALVVLEHVHHRAVGHPQPGQRTALELLHPAIALQVQTGGGAQPVRPVVVLEHGGRAQRLALRAVDRGQCLIGHPQLPQLAMTADPDQAIAVHADPGDHAVAQLRLGHPVQLVIFPADQAGTGTNPHPPALVRAQHIDLAVRQLVGLPADADLADAALFVDQAQAFAIATHPQHPVHPGQ